MEHANISYLFSFDQTGEAVIKYTIHLHNGKIYEIIHGKNESPLTC